MKPYQLLVSSSPNTSAGEASTAKPRAHASCSGTARHGRCQPMRSEPHMHSTNSGYSSRCCTRRASQGANTCSTFMSDRLACMLFAYMTFEIAT